MLKKTAIRYKNVLRNFSALLILQGVRYISPLIVLPYLISVLGIERYGITVLASTVVAYFLALVSYGFNYTGTRQIAASTGNKDDIQFIFSKVFFTKLLLTLIALLVFIAVVLVIPEFRNEYIVYLLAFLPILSELILSAWFFQGMEKMKFIAIVNTIGVVAYLILTFLFIKDKDDYVLVPLFEGGSALLSSFFSLYILKKKFGIKYILPHMSEIKAELKDGFHIFMTVLLPNLYSNSTALLLGLFAGNSALGVYNAFLKPISAFTTFNEILTRAFYPYLSKDLSGHKLFSRLSLITSSLFTAFILSIGGFLIEILFKGKAPDDAFLLISILAFSPIIMAVTNIYGTNYLVVNKYDKVYFKIIFFASIMGLILAFPLILNWNVTGAAINLNLSRLMIAAGCYSFYRKILKKAIMQDVLV